LLLLYEIATHNGLDGPWITSRWRWHVPHPSKLALGHIQPPAQWVPGLYKRQSDRSVAFTTQPI
jgi:hypothetical protein